jgi:pyruvate dehydrogenase E2 component (dihydrolipoamide acetyltransferase)
MSREFKLPDLGEGIHEGEIIDVLVSVGDRVEDGQTIMVVETDKASTEVPSPVTGVVKEIRVKPGDVVKVGDVLMTFTVEGEEEETKADAKKLEKPAEAEKAAKPDRVQEREAAPKAAQPERKEPEAERPGEREPVPVREGPVPASPSTRRLARELGVDLRKVPPSGPAGLVTAEDVKAFAAKGKEAPQPAKAPAEPEKPAEAPAAPARLQAPSAELPDFSQWGPVERVPLRSIRRATARHMALAWSQIPHVTHQDVADITLLEGFRRKHKAEIEAQGGALSLTVFALKAAVAALKAFPRVNSSLDPGAEEIILKHHYHVGVAVDTERGLIVPVIRDVDRKSITELSKELSDLAQRTRDGKVDYSEMVGGTFTITNIGPLGGTGFNPIVNYPQVAILGMAQARLQPVVRGDLSDFEIVPRLMLPLCLGFDHRVVDGADAARFLGMVIEALGDPEKLLMMS